MSKFVKRHKPHDLFCLICGKKCDELLDGKVCSIECSDVLARGIHGKKAFCNNCGIIFVALQNNSRFCPECKTKKKNCACFYPYSRVKVGHRELQAPASEFASSDRDFLSLNEVDRICKREGITYGEYMRRQLCKRINLRNLRCEK